jgi:hypothetical protein
MNIFNMGAVGVRLKLGLTLTQVQLCDLNACRSLEPSTQGTPSGFRQMSDMVTSAVDCPSQPILVAPSTVLIFWSTWHWTIFKLLWKAHLSI